MSLTSLLPEAIQRFASRLKFPQLFLLVAGLFLADLVFPDIIPFIDEIILGLLALLLGLWQDRTKAPAKGPARKDGPEVRDITPDEGPAQSN